MSARRNRLATLEHDDATEATVLYVEEQDTAPEQEQDTAPEQEQDTAPEQEQDTAPEQEQDTAPEQEQEQEQEQDRAELAKLAILAAVDAAQADGGMAAMVTIAPAVAALRPMKREATAHLAAVLADEQDLAISQADMARLQALANVNRAISAALAAPATKGTKATPRQADPVAPVVLAMHRAHAFTLAADVIAQERDAALASLSDDQRQQASQRFTAALPNGATDPLAMVAYLATYGPTSRKGRKVASGEQDGPRERATIGRSLASLADGPVTFSHGGTTYNATVSAGSITLEDGRTFSTPTAAAQVLNGGAAVNGWVAWKRDGRTLAAVLDAS